jgi:tetratricopeptide (TPR) repeat protein
MAEASGDDLIRVTGRHATSYTHLFRGEFEAALREAEAGLALFDLEREKALANAFQLSSAVCLRQSRAQALWMLGRVAEADEEAERMLQLARDLDHRASLAAALAFALHGGGARYSYTGEMARLRGIATELRQLSHDEGFFLWCAVAEVYLGVIGQVRGEGDARMRMKEGLELFAQTRTRVTAVMMNVIVAEALYDVGEDAEALSLLEEAEKDSRERDEGFYAPEIWRVRGRFFARQGKLAQAESTYRRALEIAAMQKAHSLALRAAIDLFELLDAEGRTGEGRASLATVLDRAHWTTDRPEPARARALLHSSLLHSTTGTSHVG